jgi:hypothetical protein
VKPMSNPIRRLNPVGLDKFEKYIRDLQAGQTPALPHDLLTDPGTSDATDVPIVPDQRQFTDRADLGRHLAKILSGDAHHLSHDVGLLSALTLFWFDQLCAPRADGKRRPGEMARYIFEPRRKTYRHLVWGSWWAMSTFGDNGAYLLLQMKPGAHPLEFGGGEVMGQLAANQMTTGGETIIKLGKQLFSDPNTGRQRRGSGGSAAGSPRSFIRVLRQLELNYDFRSMDTGAVSKLLPGEFDKWKNPSEAKA